MKILVVRNDKLGDFMLSYPCFSFLKAALPNARLYALVPSYTASMAELCSEIDQVLIDPSTQGSVSSVLALARTLRQEKFDVMLTLFSSSRVGLAGMLARIPYRLAPASKLAQIFYNHRLAQRRSRSEKPEYQYNIDLIRHFLDSRNTAVPRDPTPPFLHFDEGRIKQLREHFCHLHGISSDQRLIFVHPGSGGSANNLSIKQFAKLVFHLRSGGKQTFVITAGPNEMSQSEALCKRLEDIPHVLYASTSGLARFAEHIQLADLFISGSTGPLHIAGALDVPTVAFYTRRPSATALRWQTLNSPSRRLCFSAAEGSHAENMQSIDLEAAAGEISEKYLSGAGNSIRV